MFKFLVVDDEVLLRKDIIMLLKRGNIPYSSIIEAENGQEALAAIAAEVPDIALIDIRMPGMSGLDVLKSIHMKHPDIQVIIVSGYADFSYAQEALRNGALDYILKPVEDDKFYSSVRTAAEQIIIRHNRLSSVEIEEFIYKTMLSNNKKSISDSTAGNELMKGNYFSAAVFLCNKGSLKYSQEEMLFNLCNLLETCCRNIHGAVYFKNKLNSNEVILIAWDPNSREASQKLRNIISGIWDIISSYSGGHIMVGTGRTEYGTNSLPGLYRGCHEALKKRFLNRDGSEIFLYGEDDAGDTGSELYTRFMQTMESINRLADYPEKTIDTMFSLSAFQRLSLDHIKRIFSSLVTALIPVSDLDIAAVTGSILDNFNTVGEIKDYLYNLCKSTGETANTGDISGLIPEICTFIKANYNKDISLTLLAEKYSVNPNYLSEVFREKTGVNFRDYLAEARLQVAKELLKSTNMSIKKISHAIGYNSQGYFQKVFKKQYDITPMDYRATFSEN